MRFKRYLTESRSKSISKEKAFEWIKKNAKDALKKSMDGNYIYRGIERKDDALIIDPKKSKRTSRYVGSNYYTMLIDNLPSWKQYPKRSQSIIGTTDRNKGESYSADIGTPYIVFPKDGSKIAVAPKSDIFYSFSVMLNSTRNTTMAGWSDNIKLLDNKITGKRSDKSWKDMLKFFKSIDNKKEQINDLIKLYYYDFLLDKNGAFNAFDKIMHPKRNGFSLHTMGASTLPIDREVWTDGECVMLSYQSFNQLTGRYGEDSEDFIPNHKISDLMIIRDDIYDAYNKMYVDMYRMRSDKFPTVIKYDDDYWVINGFESIVKAIMQGKNKIDMKHQWVDADYYYHGEELFKYKPNLKYKGMEDFSMDDLKTSQETIEDDAREWGYIR